MFLRDLAVHAADAIVDRYPGGFVQRFHRESLSVTEALVAEISSQIETSGIAKIGLTFTDLIQVPPPLSPERCFYPWPFDFSAYVSAATDSAKQSLLLATLRSALVQIGICQSWNTDHLCAAADRIVAKNFAFTGCLKKTWPSRDQQFRTRICFDWKLNHIDLTAVLFRNKSSRELARVPLGPELPSDGILHDIAANSQWKSATRFVIHADKSFRKPWTADFQYAMREAQK